MSNRNPGIDLVRAMGVLAIVAGHVWLEEPLHRMLFAWHVPLFFFLSGYLWRRRPLRTELAVRSRSLLKPYAFWFVLLFALFATITLARGRMTLGLAAGPVYGGKYATQPFSTFWFVFVLFATAVMWQALHLFRSWIRVTVLLTALLATVFAGPALAQTPLAIGTALPALILVAAGTWARAAEDRLTGKAWMASIALIASLLVVAARLVAPVDIKSGLWGTPIASLLVAIAISWSLVILATVACERAPSWVAAGITAFALCGFTIVLFHPAVLWLASGNTPAVAVFAASVALPTLVALAAQRTPLSQWVTGVPPRISSGESREGARSPQRLGGRINRIRPWSARER